MFPYSEYQQGYPYVIHISICMCVCVCLCGVGITGKHLISDRADQTSDYQMAEAIR